MKYFIKDFFSICHRIRSFLRIWSHILKKSLMENFIFCFRYRGWGKRHIMPQIEKLVIIFCSKRFIFIESLHTKRPLSSSYHWSKRLAKDRVKRNVLLLKLNKLLDSKVHIYFVFI